MTKPLPRVVLMSMWRNDTRRNLGARVGTLLSKSYPNLRWVWVVGDSSDETESELHRLRSHLKKRAAERITIVRRDTNIRGSDPHTRMLRCTATFNACLDQTEADDDFVIWHESDLVTPPDLVERLLSHGKDVIAGWPVLRLGNGWVFYDTWGYRVGGDKFTNEPPYHPVYRPDAVFEVDTVGSCWMFPAREVRQPDGLRCTDMGVVELCDGLRQRGYRVWVDPRLTIIQPSELWDPAIGWN